MKPGIFELSRGCYDHTRNKTAGGAEGEHDVSKADSKYTTKEGIPHHFVTYSQSELDAAVAKAVALERERILALIDNGVDRHIPDNSAKCSHGVYQWEDCLDCVEAAIRGMT